jgi:hypothetical protein
MALYSGIIKSVLSFGSKRLFSGMNTTRIENNSSKHLKFGETIFNKEKIISVQARNSFLYLRYPYIFTIKYAKIHKTTTYVGAGSNVHFSLPLEDIHSSIQFKYKYKEKADIKEALLLFQDCPNCKITDEL